MRMRICIFLTGLVLVCLAAVLFGYALWPLPPGQQQATLPATLFLAP